MNRGSAGKATSVSQGYAAALRRHLTQGPRASLRTAGGLGHRAVAAGLATSDLARIHEQAVIGLISVSDSARTTDGKIARAAPFLVAALRPFANTQHAAVEKNGHLKRRRGTMRRRTVDLTDSKRQLKRESIRRRKR